MKSKLSGVIQPLAGYLTITVAAATLLCLPVQGFSQETTASQPAKTAPKKNVAPKKKSAPVKKGASAASKTTTAPLCVTQINVIEGCEACEALMDWLKSGGVKLQIKKIETGKYKLFPTVEYSDKSTDHGEKLYEQTAQIPASLAVVSCKAVSE